MTKDLLLEINSVAKSYGPVVALKNANLSVRPGEIHALLGANGAGKSTLVKILTGVISSDTGYISLHGQKFHLQMTREKMVSHLYFRTLH